MQCAQTIVLVAGLRHQEFLRLHRKVSDAGLDVELREGKHISEGSNCSRGVRSASESAELILLQTNGIRYVRRSDLHAPNIVSINGVSSAFNAISRTFAGTR